MKRNRAPTLETIVVLALIALLANTPGPAADEESKPTSAEAEESTPEPTAFVIEQLETRYEMHNDGTGTITVRTRTRIENEDGRRAYSQLYFPYRSEITNLDVRSVRTIKPSGEVVEADLGTMIQVTPPIAQQAPTYTDLVYTVVPTPAIEIGDRIESESAIRIVSPLKPGDFWLSHYLASNVLVQSEVVELDLPAGRSLSFAADPDYPYATEKAGDRLIRKWRILSEIPRPGTAHPRRLFAVSTFGSWAELGSWLYGLVEERREVTDHIAQVAAGLVQDRATPRDRIEAIYNYVSGSVRYVAITLGLGGYRPHSAMDVEKNQYGDCKDKHVLMSALLSAAGIESHAALVHSSQPVNPDVPSPDEFDHMVTVVELDDRQLWMDASPGTAPLGYLIPTLRGEKALLLRSEGSELVPIPTESPIPNFRRMTMSGSVNATGSLAAVMRAENRGDSEVLWRQIKRSLPAERFASMCKFDLPFEFMDSEISDVEASDPMDLRDPFVVTYSVGDDEFLDALQDSTRRTLPRLALSDEQWDTEDDEDKNKEEEPIALGGPLELTDRFELTFEDAFTVQVPAPVETTSDFATYRAEYAYAQGKLTATRTLEILKRELPASRLQELRDFSAAMEADRNRELVFVATGQIDRHAAMDKLSADSLDSAGLKLLEGGNVLEARDLFLKATEKDPQHRDAWNNLGRTYLVVGDLDAAEDAFRKQLAVDEHDEYANLNLGVITLLRGDNEKAIEFFERQLTVNPRDTFTLQQLAQAFAALRRWEKVEEVAQRALKIAPAEAALWVLIGRSQMEQHKTEAAMASFDHAVEINRSPVVFNNIAYALAEVGGELDAALTYAESAVARAELELRLVKSLKGWPRTYVMQYSLGTYLDTYGWILYRQGEQTQAREVLGAAFSLAEHSEIALHLAQAEGAAGHADDALAFFARAVHLSQRDRLDVPEGIRELTAERFEDDDALFAWVEEQRVEYVRAMKMPEAEAHFKWPEEASTERSIEISLVLLVDDDGSVLEARAGGGPSVWSEAAVSGASTVHLPPVKWNDRAIDRLCMVVVTYRPSHEIELRQASSAEVKRMWFEHASAIGLDPSSLSLDR